MQKAVDDFAPEVGQGQRADTKTGAAVTSWLASTAANGQPFEPQLGRDDRGDDQ
jgi:hypothetical protein